DHHSQRFHEPLRLFCCHDVLQTVGNGLARRSGHSSGIVFSYVLERALSITRFPPPLEPGGPRRFVESACRSLHPAAISCVQGNSHARQSPRPCNSWICLELALAIGSAPHAPTRGPEVAPNLS